MLNPKRKADRAAMVARLRTLAAEHGATFSLTAEGSTFYTKRGFHVTLSRDSLNAFMSVHGNGLNEKENVYVVSWWVSTANPTGAERVRGEAEHEEGGRHTDTSASAEVRLSSAFECACGKVNTFHRHKATTVCRGFEETILRIEIGFMMVANGRAFETAKEAVS